jgi:hypothetical protein
MLLIMLRYSHMFTDVFRFLSTRLPMFQSVGISIMTFKICKFPVQNKSTSILHGFIS